MFRFTRNTFFYAIVGALSFISFFIMLFSVFLLLKNSWNLLSEYKLSTLFLSSQWNPYENLFGFKDMILASAALAILSLILCLPLAVIISVGLKYYFPKSWDTRIHFLINLMLAIPSVVFGLWVLQYLSPMMIRLDLPGMNLLLGVIVLVAILLPTMIALLKSSLDQLEPSLVQSVESLGLSKEWSIARVYLPSIKKNIFSSCVISLARALGETMAVLMVCGNIIQAPVSLFEPVRALTANIALEMSYALGSHRDALYLSGLCLLLVVIILAVFAQYLANSKRLA